MSSPTDLELGCVLKHKPRWFCDCVFQPIQTDSLAPKDKEAVGEVYQNIKQEVNSPLP